MPEEAEEDGGFGEAIEGSVEDGAEGGGAVGGAGDSAIEQVDGAEDEHGDAGGGEGSGARHDAGSDVAGGADGADGVGAEAGAGDGEANRLGEPRGQAVGDGVADGDTWHGRLPMRPGDNEGAALVLWERGEAAALSLVEEAFVVGEDVLGDVGPIELVDAHPSTLGEAVPETGVQDEGAQGLAEGAFIARADEEGFLAVGDDVGESGDVGGDDGEAGGHGFGEDDAEAFVAGVGGAENIGGVEVAKLLLLRDEAGEDNIGEAGFLDGRLVATAVATFAHDDEPDVGILALEAGVGAEEVLEAFALFEAPEEEDVDLAIAVAGVGRGIGGVVGDVDAVGDDGEGGGEVALDQLRGGGGDGDAPVQAGEPALDEAAAVGVEAGSAFLGGVECADGDGGGGPQGSEGDEGDARHERFVEVDDIETLMLQDFGDAAAEAGVPGDAGDGAAEVDGDGAPDDDDAFADDVAFIGSGGEDANLVAELAELGGELEDVAVDAAGNGEIVGGDEGDLHGFCPWSRRLRGRMTALCGVTMSPRHCCRMTVPTPSWRRVG